MENDARVLHGHAYQVISVEGLTGRPLAWQISLWASCLSFILGPLAFVYLEPRSILLLRGSALRSFDAHGYHMIHRVRSGYLVYSQPRWRRGRRESSPAF